MGGRLCWTKDKKSVIWEITEEEKWVGPMGNGIAQYLHSLNILRTKIFCFFLVENNNIDSFKWLNLLVS